jgi:inositol phosphorylceramide synthase catalytic subunit
VTTDAAAWWNRLHRHIRELWPRRAFLPVFLFVGWPVYCFAIGERRWEFAVSIFLGGVLPYVGPTSKRVFIGIMPIGMVGLFYDWMRFVRNVGLTPERVHVCDLRALEIRLFGVNLGDRVGTVHDLVQSAPSLPLDVFFAVPYGTFIGVAALFALFLYFVDYEAMRRFSGAFLVLNVLAFVTYRLYPAAPPWYFHAHGCVADLATRASEGPNLARVDAWLGFRYFGGFYARSTNVFGAVPSLHVAYPLLAAIEGFRPFGAIRGARWLKWPLRVSSVLFFVWMCVAAVYLDHHWVLDLACGCFYALVVCLAFRKLSFLAPVAGRVDEPLPAAQ